MTGRRVVIGHMHRWDTHWRHNERYGVSNHQLLDYSLNRLFRCRSTSKFRVTGLCGGNSLVTSEFPAQRASNAEIVSNVTMALGQIMAWCRTGAKPLSEPMMWHERLKSLVTWLFIQHHVYANNKLESCAALCKGTHWCGLPPQRVINAEYVPMVTCNDVCFLQVCSLI